METKEENRAKMILRFRYFEKAFGRKLPIGSCGSWSLESGVPESTE
jgi:hypothetical protein